MRSAVEHRLTLPDDATALALLAGAVAAFAERAPLVPRQAHDLHLILEELVTNTMTHGYGHGGEGSSPAPGGIAVVLRCSADRVVRAELRDRAKPFNPLADRPSRPAVVLEDVTPGGLGLAIVRRLIRGGAYRRADGCNILTFELRDPPP